MTPEHQFARPSRKWAFDRAHILAHVAIELEGGTWGRRNKDGELVPGRHVRGKGYADDCIKYNAATALGWAVFRLTSDMLRDDPHQHLTPIIATIESRLNA